MLSQSSNKSSSRWGSFLQQAVAGVESRLDTILADEDAKPSAGPANESRQSPKVAMNKEAHTPTLISSSHSQRHDHLQERLAKAVVTRSNSRPAAQLSTDSTLSSRSASPATTFLANGNSIQVPKLLSDDSCIKTHKHSVQYPGFTDDEVFVNMPEGVPSGAIAMQSDHDLLSAPKRTSRELNGSYQSTKESHSPSGNRGLVTIDIQSRPPHLKAKADSFLPVVDMTAMAGSQNLSSETAGTQSWQEETNADMEHIDVLQAKLRYLTKEAMEASKVAASKASAGSIEQELALKDERIANLVEENRKLLQYDLEHIATTHQLRARLRDEAKLCNKANAKMSGITEAAWNRADRAELTARVQSEKSDELLRTQNDIETLKMKTHDQEYQITVLRQQLSIAKGPKYQEHLSRLEGLLNAENKKNLDLRDDLSNMKIEKELGDERQRTRLRDLQEKLDQEKLITKRLESELRTELRVLEGRLESYRIQAEEASSTDTKDNKAKLLRQTDVLQSQYAIATENWRGIESSLLARIASIEKERAESKRKENESRRKIREASIKQRQVEEDLQHANKDSIELQETIGRLNARLAEMEKILGRTQKEVEITRLDLTNRNALAAHLAEQLNDIKTRHNETSPMISDMSHLRANADSSGQLLYQKFGIERPDARRSQPIKTTSGFGNGSTTQLDRLVVRRRSTQPSHVSGDASPIHQDSTPHLISHALNDHTPETPSIRTEQFEDVFDGTTTPLTPDRTINDVISVSTTAAGPSVQLIERMSAAVRRLETEKALSQDELERVTAQRDETRKQVTSLLQEIREKEDASARAKDLEREVAAINQRYQTTLEMLGEKSELVEELRSDVADVKQMYKDLVESTLR